jgi:hypothetical protein
MYSLPSADFCQLLADLPFYVSLSLYFSFRYPCAAHTVFPNVSVIISGVSVGLFLRFAHNLMPTHSQIHCVLNTFVSGLCKFSFHTWQFTDSRMGTFLSQTRERCISLSNCTFTSCQLWKIWSMHVVKIYAEGCTTEISWMWISLMKVTKKCPFKRFSHTW